MTSDELLREFEEDLYLRNLAPASIMNMHYTIRKYLAWADSMGVDPTQASPVKYLAYLRKDLKSASIKTEFARLAVFYEFMEDRGLVQSNPVHKMRKYFHEYKKSEPCRHAISIEDAARMIHLTIDSRDKAVLLLLFTTGIRRNELVSLDIDDIDIDNLICTLKETAKRSNRTVFFTEETARVLTRWLKSREMRYKKEDERALFIGAKGTRLGSNGVDLLVRHAAARVGLYDGKSNRSEDKFTPHWCRHCLATWLLDAEMPERYLAWLRGDAWHYSHDRYNHMKPEKIKEDYLLRAPRFGV